MEHIESFQRYSRFKVWGVNTALGFPKALKHLRFSIILLHYSLPVPPTGSEIAGLRPHLTQPFRRYLDECSTSYKVVFYQDEHYYCQQRIAFLNRYRVACVYTLVKPAQFEDVYRECDYGPKLVNTLPGYVSNELVEASHRFTVANADRGIDVGYRGRQLDYYMGKGAQEKVEIANGFKERADGLGLSLDTETEERFRVYGDAWYQYLANCRAVLGVEAGISIFDTSGEIRVEYDRLMALKPDMSFEEVSELHLAKWEDRIPYRNCSPRNFEAAAFRVCQILFEGGYSGIMQPMVHYIPLRKDFSNFDDVIKAFRDTELRRELTENAFRDLIAAPTYRYEEFIKIFDQELVDAGLQPDTSVHGERKVASALYGGPSETKPRMGILQLIKLHLMYYPFPGRYSLFPGRQFLRPFLRPLYDLLRNG